MLIEAATLMPTSPIHTFQLDNRDAMIKRLNNIGVLAATVNYPMTPGLQLAYVRSMLLSIICR